MSGSYESAVEQFDLTEIDTRRAALRDIQLAQAEQLRKSGVLTRALFAAEKQGQTLYSDAAYWACVYKTNGRYGIRFMAYSADSIGELPVNIIDVPVYDTGNGTNTPLKPFDDVEMGHVAAAALTLEFEQQFGEFPDLSPDLTDLVAP
jgi:hypothetical protein